MGTVSSQHAKSAAQTNWPNEKGKPGRESLNVQTPEVSPPLPESVGVGCDKLRLGEKNTVSFELDMF